MTSISKDIPLSEITLRKYERPENLDKRELTRKLCLSIGLLQPGDSRDIIVDILLTLIQAKSPLTSKQIEENVINLRKQNNLPLKGIAGSNIRRQIKRLKDIFIIENINNKYRITENETLSNIFTEKIEKFYIRSILERVQEYFGAVK
ncbi:MAG: hypothetical protein KKG60_02780 [Nanoarchaeota archaeon]|nr:hypothetical protein [Nanoarchaeota archaeon]